MYVPNDVIDEACEQADNGNIVEVAKIQLTNQFGHVWGETHQCKAVAEDQYPPITWKKWFPSENGYEVAVLNRDSMLLRKLRKS